jgi:signal transduction histidine kinase
MTWWRGFLRAETGILAAAGLALTLAWAATGAGHFWPGWVWFALGVVLGLQWSVHWALGARKGHRLLAAQAAVSLVIVAAGVMIWLMSGFGAFWPAWPAVVLGFLLGLHLWLVRRPPPSRERALEERVDVLTRTRSGALDVQAAELRRIERDLHDGAQARLVSVAMTVGLAEELLRADPEAVAGLLAEARSTTLSALDDLRTVMRGIQPPVLADRGLAGAVEALALDVAIPVTVTVTESQAGRVPAPVETAVYFAVAECLANVVKHSGAGAAWVTLGYGGAALSAVVGDNGTGGASLSGGSGLPGIARRLAPFDGTLAVASPPGGPTTVTLEVPCALS